MVPTYLHLHLDTCRRDLLSFGTFKKNGTQKQGTTNPPHGNPRTPQQPPSHEIATRQWKKPSDKRQVRVHETRGTDQRRKLSLGRPPGSTGGSSCLGVVQPPRQLGWGVPRCVFYMKTNRFFLSSSCIRQYATLYVTVGFGFTRPAGQLEREIDGGLYSTLLRDKNRARYRERTLQSRICDSFFLYTLQTGLLRLGAVSCDL